MGDESESKNHIEEFDDIGTDGPIVDCIPLTTIKEYVIYLDEEIRSPEKYRSAIASLRRATEHDVVTIKINSPGGYVHTAVQVVNAILDCRAMVIGEVYEASSAASIIALACDGIRPMKFSYMMFHAATYWAIGNTRIIPEQVEFHNKRLLDLQREVTKGFLIPKELKRIEEGGEVYIAESEIHKRLKKWKPMSERQLVTDENESN